MSIAIAANTRYKAAVTLGAGDDEIALGFPVLDADEVTVRRVRAGVETILTLNTHYTIDDLDTLPGATVILSPVAQAGDVYDAWAATAIERATVFANGGAFSPALLNREGERRILVEQELARDVARALKKDFGGTNYDAGGLKIANLAAAEEDDEAVTKGQMVEADEALAEAVAEDVAAAAASAGAAAISAAAASASAGTAAGHASAASDHKDAAEGFRDEAEAAAAAASVLMVTSRTALATQTADRVLLEEGGGPSLWNRVSGDISAFVAADAAQGCYIALASDPDGSSGGYVRQRRSTEEFVFEWFQPPAEPGPTEDATPAADACLALMKLFPAASLLVLGLHWLNTAPAVATWSGEKHFAITGTGRHVSGFVVNNTTGAFHLGQPAGRTSSLHVSHIGFFPAVDGAGYGLKFINLDGGLQEQHLFRAFDVSFQPLDDSSAYSFDDPLEVLCFRPVIENCYFAQGTTTTTKQGKIINVSSCYKYEIRFNYIKGAADYGIYSNGAAEEAFRVDFNNIVGPDVGFWHYRTSQEPEGYFNFNHVNCDVAGAVIDGAKLFEVIGNIFYSAVASGTYEDIILKDASGYLIHSNAYRTPSGTPTRRHVVLAPATSANGAPTNAQGFIGPDVLNATAQYYVDIGANVTHVTVSEPPSIPSGTGISYGTLTNVANSGNTNITVTRGIQAPITKTADFSVGVGEGNFINNKSGSSCTVTLPAAAQWPGRQVALLNWQAQTVVSATSNVVPRAGGAAGTAILPAYAGAWALLFSDGTNWNIMQASPGQALDTSASPQFTALNIGHASDSPLARLVAGMLGVAGRSLLTVLAADGTGYSLTGTTAETTLKTVTVPAGLLGPNGGLVALTLHTYTNNANNKSLIARFGGTGGTLIDNRTVTTTLVAQKLFFMMNRNNVASQICLQANDVDGVGTGAAAVTPTVDTSAAVDLVFRAQLADAGDTVTLAALLVLAWHGG